MKDYSIAVNALNTAEEALKSLKEAKEVEFDSKSEGVIERVGEYLFELYSTNGIPYHPHYLAKRMGSEVSRGTPSGQFQVLPKDNYVTVWVAADGGSLTYHVFPDYRVDINVSDSQRFKAGMFLAYHWQDFKKNLNLWIEEDLVAHDKDIKKEIDELKYKDYIFDNFKI